MNSDHRRGYVTMVNPAKIGRAPCGYATQNEPQQNAVGRVPGLKEFYHPTI